MKSLNEFLNENWMKPRKSNLDSYNDTWQKRVTVNIMLGLNLQRKDIKIDDDSLTVKNKVKVSTVKDGYQVSGGKGRAEKIHAMVPDTYGQIVKMVARRL